MTLGKRVAPLLIAAVLTGLTATTTQAGAVAAHEAAGDVTPADALDLGSWWLQLPVVDPDTGYARTVRQPELSTFENAPWFATAQSGAAVQLEARVDGATTAGTAYPRSELREATDNGTDKASWSITSGKHTLEVTASVLHVPAVRQKVVTSQIHDGTSDVVEVLADGTRATAAGRYAICVRYDGGTTCPTRTYVPGTPYRIRIVASGGWVRVSYNGARVLAFADTSTTCYFKAGAYVLANPTTGDSPDDYGLVDLQSLRVTHQ